MLSQLIQRLRDARSQRRLFTGERGAIAASLIEIGVAMLAVGILTAGAVTTFTGFIDSASDTTARGRLTDAASTSDQVYNWLRPGGERCYTDTACANTNATAVSALQEAAGGQLTFDEWDNDFPDANTIYVQVETSYAAAANNKKTTAPAATGNHNGIAGDPDAGHWVRLAIRSDSGATFCVVKVAQTAKPAFEGVGYMSVTSDDSETTATSAHCGGHIGTTGATTLPKVTIASCVYGSEGASTTTAASTVAVAVARAAADMKIKTALSGTTEAALCFTQRALGRPGAGPVITS